MGTTIIKDAHYRIIGYIKEESNGDKQIQDSRYKILGYYKRNQNVTMDSRYKIIAYGDVLTAFLADELF